VKWTTSTLLIIPFFIRFSSSLAVLSYKSIDFKIYDDGYSTPYGLQSYSEMKLNICKEIFEDKN